MLIFVKDFAQVIRDIIFSIKNNNQKFFRIRALNLQQSAQSFKFLSFFIK